MRIAITIATFNSQSGGAAAWVRGFVRHVLSQGHEVHVLTFDVGEAIVDAEGTPLPGVTVHLLETDPLQERQFEIVGEAVRSLQLDCHYDTGIAPRADVFHPHSGSETHSWMVNTQTTGLRGRIKRASLPHLHTIESRLLNVERSQVANASIVAAMSTLAAGVQRKLLLARPAQQRSIDPGIDAARFVPGWIDPTNDVERRELRASWDCSASDVVFLVAAHNSWLKGIDFVLDALADLASRPEIQIVVAGGADEWLLGQIRRRGLGRRVVIAGVVDDMPALYRAVDALLHPARWDSSPLVVLEAMAAGLPVVVSRHVGYSELLHDGEDGYVLPARFRARHIGKTMVRLLDRDLRARIGRQARVTAEELGSESGYISALRILERAAELRLAKSLATSAPTLSHRMLPASGPMVSVVMPVRNGERFLTEAIESILSQTFTDLVLHVVDDGSTDRSAQIVEEFSQRDPRVVLLRQPASGIVAALNRGVLASTTPYVARMDADDVSLPDRFALQIGHLERSPELVVLGGNYERIDVDGRTINVEHLACSPVAVDWLLAATNPIAHPAAMIRRRVFDEVGLYRTTFPLCDDYDLWLRARSVGEISNVPEVVLRYRVHPGQTSTKIPQRLRSEIGALAAHRIRQSGGEDPSDSLPPIRSRIPRALITADSRIDQIAIDRVSATIRDAWLRSDARSYGRAVFESRLIVELKVRQRFGRVSRSSSANSSAP